MIWVAYDAYYFGLNLAFQWHLWVPQVHSNNSHVGKV